MSEENSEALYDLLLALSPDPMVLADARTGIMLKISPAMESLLEWPAGDLVGQHQTILHPAEDIAERQFSEAFDQHRSGVTRVNQNYRCNPSVAL